MSQTVHLLRLWSVFRYGQETEIATNQRAFSTREEAERYARENPPVYLNPFVDLCREGQLADGTFPEDDDYWIGLTFTNSELETPTYHSNVNLTRFRELITTRKVTPPQWDDDEASVEGWQKWWDKTAPTMTPEQKRVVWLFVVPEPYQIVEVEIEE
jgi:hypothetical protein